MLNKEIPHNLRTLHWETKKRSASLSEHPTNSVVLYLLKKVIIPSISCDVMQYSFKVSMYIE